MIVTRADNDAVLTTEDVLLSLCNSVTGVLSAATQTQVRFSGMVQRISKTCLKPDIGCFVLFDGGFSGLVVINFSAAAAMELYQSYMLTMGMPESARSDDIDTHTRTSMLRVHKVATGDTDISMADEPGHQDLCNREQAFVARAIHERLDLTRHIQDAVQSLVICLAADESVRSGQPVKL